MADKIIKALHDFDVENSNVTLWTFKKSWNKGNEVPIYKGRWVATTKDLVAALRESIDTARTNVTETLEYELLAQNNENSALSISLDETYASLIIDQVADPTAARKIKKLQEISNATFYVVKLSANGQTLYGVRKTDDSWRTKKAKNSLVAVFKDEQMALETGASFTISKYFDFFIQGDVVLVTNKSQFESLLSYKQAHKDEFSSLQKEAEFLSIFTDIKHIVEFVGTNKMQLRRISAIRQKGHYKNADFMKRLWEEHKNLGFKINFDKDGKITPSADLECCRDIFRALLDHRLDSRLSKTLYDVESTAEVA